MAEDNWRNRASLNENEKGSSEDKDERTSNQNLKESYDSESKQSNKGFNISK